MNDGEEALVIRSRTGDRAAFEELVRKTARGIFARCYLRARNVHRAEDLVQETFLRAWQTIHSVSEPQRFRAWLNSIADSVATDLAKHDSRKKRGGVRLDLQAMFAVSDGCSSPAQLAARNDERDHVLEILRTLPDEYREVLALRYLAGADYDTIAKQLAISNGSLRGLLNRGMKMLREKMLRPS